jgi:hypothetical protein
MLTHAATKNSQPVYTNNHAQNTFTTLHNNASNLLSSTYTATTLDYSRRIQL